MRWLLTCPFLEQKRVHTYWTVEHSCDISLSLFPIIYYLVAKDTILYLLSLFDERREQKKLSRRMVFVVERNEDVVLLRARARPKAFARLIMEKMTCTEKRKKEQNG